MHSKADNLDDLTGLNPLHVIWRRGAAAQVSSQLQIVGVGWHDDIYPYIVDRPHGTDDHLLMHFHTASSVHHDREMHSYPPHTFFLWQPGQRHTFGHPQRDWRHSWMHCHGRLIQSEIAATRIPLNQPVFLGNAFIIERYLKPIFEELRGSLAQDEVMIESHVRILLRALHRATHAEIPPHQVPERILNSLRWIELNLANPLSLADLAAHSHLSISRFSAEFRRHVGASPMAYMLSQRMQQAVHWLRDCNLSIEEVAHRAGFKDSFYFSRQFRRHHGLSPMQYRAKWINGAPGRS